MEELKESEEVEVRKCHWEKTFTITDRQIDAFLLLVIIALGVVWVLI